MVSPGPAGGTRWVWPASPTPCWPFPPPDIGCTHPPPPPLSCCPPCARPGCPPPHPPPPTAPGFCRTTSHLPNAPSIKLSKLTKPFTLPDCLSRWVQIPTSTPLRQLRLPSLPLSPPPVTFSCHPLTLSPLSPSQRCRELEVAASARDNSPLNLSHL